MKIHTHITLIFVLLVSSAFSQDLISIVGRSPFPPETKVVFTGFEGFRPTELGSIRVTSGQQIDYFTSYHGLCMMSAEGYPEFALILENDPTCIEWDSLPSFPCDQENIILYAQLPALDTISSWLSAWRESTDSLIKADLQNMIGQSIEQCRKEVESTAGGKAGLYIEASLKAMEAAMVTVPAIMGDHKSEILDFIGGNFQALYHSDRMITLSEAYVNMNKQVFSSEMSATQASVYDVEQWISALEGMLPAREIVEHFLLMFAKMGEADVLAQLLEAQAGNFECEQYVGNTKRPANMPYTFSVFVGPDLGREYTLDQFTGMKKILAMYSPDCPASIAALVALYGYMSANQLRIPVILVPDNELEDPLKSVVREKAPFGMQTGMKMGGSLMMGAGIQQLPAYIILDQRNLLSDVFYSFSELKAYLSE